MNCLRIFLIFCLLAGVLSGCASPKNLIVLVPDEQGRVGQILVENEKGSQLLTEAWSATRIADAQQAPGAPTKVSEREVRAIFEQALSALPSPPERFLLYFEMDSERLTPESAALIDKVLQSIMVRESVDTSIIGHTDTVGAEDYNYRLALRRAEAVAELFMSQGVSRQILSIGSHGEKDLLIETGDNVFEPRNRRVEITVR